MDNLANIFLWYLVFLFSTVVHEAAHAFSAKKLGDNTAYYGGQVTLDPRPHIRREVIGTTVVPIISFLVGGWMIGWASTPYDPVWARNYPERSAWMSLAGPLSNLALVLVAGLLIRLGMLMEIFYAPDTINFSHVVGSSLAGFPETIATLLSILFSLNLILLFFNLIPLPPLDGSGAIPLFLSEEKAIKYMDFIHNTPFMFMGLMIAWQVFNHIFDPLHLMAINLLYPGLNYY